MLFSYNWLKDYVKNLPKPEKLAELLTMHTLEVEETKKAGSDWVLDIDVLPNRADCFSHIGIARECAALTNSKFQIPWTQRGLPVWLHSKQIPNSKSQTKNFVSVEVKHPQACPRYTARVVTDVRVGPSPKWLKERLEVCGLNSINNIVDIANYVMLETGQPLHVFDGDKLEGRKIIVRFAKRGEKITTLDNQKFDPDSSVLVIADAKPARNASSHSDAGGKPIAIAGIKGGKEPEVGKSTKTIVLESANFNSQTIRKGSKKLNLKTDASLRFEHGLDPNLTESAINRAAGLIQKIAGGKVAGGLIDVYPKKVYPQKLKLDLKYVESLLGIKISAKEVKNILTRLGFRIIGVGNRLMVEVPTFRQNVVIPEDLIEEIGRIYGYEKIPTVFPLAALIPAKRNQAVFWENMVKDILKELGFTEVYNYSFVSEGRGLIEVRNPVSGDYKYLRNSLVPSLLKNVQKNQKHFKEMKIFELAKVFSAQGGPASGGEKRQLAAAVFPNNFYYLKGIVDLLLQKLGISNIWYEESGKKSAIIKVDGQSLGFLQDSVFEIDFEKLQKLASEEHQYQPLSRFPSAVRDLAVLVPPRTKVAEVLNLINIAGGSLVRDVDLFDIYQGGELPDGKKNLAFHIIYQSENKTLTSDEVDKIHKKIIKILEENPTWQVRK